MSADALHLAPCPFCGHEHGETTLKCPESDMVLPLEGRMLGDKFRLSRELGRGGMATVWLAVNTLVDRPVAIKLIRPEVIRDPDVVGRFRSEAKAAGRIGHPNVCDILDFGTSPVGPFIVMEFLQGKNLGQLIAREGRLDIVRAVGLVRRALSGLHAAHERGVIHRDLKPENIFLHHRSGGQLQVKLMDFGVAKFTDGSAEVETGKGALLGTPEYMAPEQFAGAELSEPRTDIWAVGAILYRALTGEHAFRGPTVAATLFRTTQEEHRPMRELEASVPRRLEALVDRCLKKDPADRFPSVKALDDELREVLVDLDVPDISPPLDADTDHSDRIGPILIGPPSLSEVVDAIAAESLAGGEAFSQGDTTDPPGPPPPLPVRDSSPTLPHGREEELKRLRAGVDVQLGLPGPDVTPPRLGDLAEVDSIEELIDIAEDERTPPEADPGAPDLVEDATTGIAHVGPDPAPPKSLSPWPVILVATMLCLFGWGTWALITSGEQSEPQPQVQLANAGPPPRAEPTPQPATATAPPIAPPGSPPEVLPPAADPEGPKEQTLAGIETADAGGSTSGPLVDDPPPADDEVIEIIDEEEDPSALEDEGAGLDPEVDTDTPIDEAHDAGSEEVPSPAPDKRRQKKRKKKASPRPAEQPEVVSPPAGVTLASGHITPLQVWPRMEQSAAKKHCQALGRNKFLGVSRWRLANPATAKKFSRVSQMKRGRYWTTARYRGRARVIEIPTAKSASVRVDRKFRPLCVARWP